MPMKIVNTGSKRLGSLKRRNPFSGCLLPHLNPKGSLKMKKALFTALLAALSAIAQAKPYPQHDMNQLVQPKSINMALANQVFNDLSEHAIAYPTRFDNATDQQRASAEAAQLAKLFRLMVETQVVTPKDAQYTGFLRQVAQTNAMAHNLDVPNAAAAADKYYQAWIARLNGKEKAQAQGEFGLFLVYSNRIDRGIATLQQALKNGDPLANRALGIAYLMKGNTAKAKQYLQAHLKNNPQDKQAATLLDAVKNGKVEVKQQ